MVERATVLKVVAVVVLLVGAGAGVYLYQLGSDFQSPQVESIENEFGAVSESTTEIEAHIVVVNPNDQRIPGAARVRYTVRMNDVRMAEGVKRGVGLQPGRNELRLVAKLDNSKVPEWWVTHVNNGERTQLTISPSISVPGLPIESTLPDRNQTITTDLVGTFARDEPRVVNVSGRRVLVVSNQSAAWGEADAETTPILVSNRIENVHDEPVRLDGVVYRIEMNGVVVGNGTRDAGLRLAPGEATTYTVRPAIDTQRMDAWWESHIRNNQTTRLSVEVYGVVERNGTRQRVPVAVFERQARIKSQFLGDGNTTVERIDTADTRTFEDPTLAETTSEWGTVGEETTEIETQVVVENPNEGDAADLLRLHVAQQTAINGVPVADGETTTGALEPGRNEVTLTSAFDHSTVPEWWARHLNRGEQSQVVTETDAVVDVGVTTFDADMNDRERTLETDLLAGFNESEPRAVEQDGRRVATIEETRATWGTASAERAPIESQVTISNERARPITIRDITYTVRLNDVVLADNRTVDESYEIGPYATRTIEPTFVLDNSKMAAWWPTHVRNGETSVLQTEVYLTVDSPFGSKRVALDAFSGNQTVETDVLG